MKPRADPSKTLTNSGKRRTAREMAVQMLYQRDLGESPLAQIFNTFDVTPYVTGDRDPDLETDGAEAAPRRPATRGGIADDPEAEARRQEVKEGFEYAKSLVQGTLDHLDQIDAMIREQADNWRLERMPAVDRNILRLAVYEMLHEREVPKLVVVDEAIELAKQFGSEQSGRFVNGLLDGLLKRHEFPGQMT